MQPSSVFGPPKVIEVRMTVPDQLYWDDAEEIALALADKFPEVNPLEVRFTDLHMWVTQLPVFADDASKSNEGKLEGIQMAWYEEYQDRRKKVS